MKQNSKTNIIRIIVTIFTLTAILVTCLIAVTPNFSVLYQSITGETSTEMQYDTYRFKQPPIQDALLCFQISNNKPNFKAPKTDKTFMRIKSKDNYGRNRGIECVLDSTTILNTDIPDISSSKQDYENIQILPKELIGEETSEREGNKTSITAYAYNHAYVQYLRQIQDYLKNSSNKVAFEIVIQYENNTSKVPQGYNLAAYSCEDNGKTLMFNVHINNITKKDT